MSDEKEKSKFEADLESLSPEQFTKAVEFVEAEKSRRGKDDFNHDVSNMGDAEFYRLRSRLSRGEKV